MQIGRRGFPDLYRERTDQLFFHGNISPNTEQGIAVTVLQQILQEMVVTVRGFHKDLAGPRVSGLAIQLFYFTYSL